ncbi:MAG: transglutaminase domain-containing protein [Lachnospiraceae bacterium]
MRKRKRSSCLGYLLGVVFVVSVVAAGIYALTEHSNVVQEVTNVLGIAPIKVPFQKITIKEESLQSKYYYHQLQESDRIIYQELLQGIRTNAKEIYVHTTDNDKLQKIYRYVLYDAPEIFWCQGSGTSNVYEKGMGGNPGYIVLMPEYQYDETAKETKQQEIEQAVTACLSNVPSDSTEYEKIKYVYEYIINHTTYNQLAADNQNIYSVFINQESVCAGYSKAMQYLLEKMGIFCTYVPGTATGQEAHAWNLVQCDGAYYYVDVTWGDPVFLQEEATTQDNTVIEDAVTEDTITYDYLCCTDEDILRTHTLLEDITYPTCTSTTYNYYILNGLYYETYNRNQILNSMYESIDNQQPRSVFKFSSTEVYEQAHYEIVDELIQKATQYIGTQYHLSEVRYSYQDEAELNKITVYWNYE